MDYTNSNENPELIQEQLNADITPETEVSATKIGVVTDCIRLNVRKSPNIDAEVAAIIPALTEVIIDENESSDTFYKVCTSDGISGFCMKKFIATRK